MFWVRALTLRFSSVNNLFFHSFIHRFPPPTLGFTNKTMTAKISAKKWEIFICKSRRMDVLKTAKA